MKKLFLIVFLSLSVLVISITAIQFFRQNKTLENVNDIKNIALETISNTSGFSVSQNTPGFENYQKLKQGCPYKDCIPSIDNPVFESVSQADKWLNGEDIIFGVDYNNIQKAYPQRILNWHEIVNDKIANTPIVITFCPLCGSAIAFNANVDGDVLTFGVSGKLLNSDLVMYDHQTKSLWEQITGTAIVGKKFNSKLTPISMDTLKWSQWKKTYPNTQVLSRDTGFSRDYSSYPYGNYETSNLVNFPVEGGVDATIHPKDIVYGIEINGKFKAYTKKALEDHLIISDDFAGQKLQLNYSNQMLKIINPTTQEEIISRRLFWFAWKAFHPQTKLFK